MPTAGSLGSVLYQNRKLSSEGVKSSTRKEASFRKTNKQDIPKETTLTLMKSQYLPGI